MSVGIGDTISTYKIIKKLGEGGMGVVYLADDTKLKRQVAIKFLPLQMIREESDRTRFLQEAQAAASINHPHVCIIHDIKENEDQQFIIMEYVQGQTLSNKINSHPLEVDRAIEYAIQIASAIHSAHEKEIIHRDIKSENIMISETDQIKVMDFGLAKIKGSLTHTKTGSTIGTLAYMAPELIEGKEVDASSDIFSFGVVLYEMLAGCLPFQEEYESALLYAILNEEPEPLGKLNHNVTDDLEKIVGKALAKSRFDRYRHMVDVLHDLKNLDGRSSNQVYRPGSNDHELHHTENQIESIVVLPLRNFSNDPEQEYFVDGMTEVLITYLSKIHALRVISRTSAMHYKDTDMNVPEIARELNVDAVVEGSVQRAGERVRITAQLIRAETDDHVWAENYDRDFKDILFLQSDVAQAIAAEVKINLSRREKKELVNIREVNPESYDAYLKGRFHWYKLSPHNVQQALDYFSLALDKDEHCVLALTGIAMVSIAQVYWGTTPPSEVMPQAKSHVLKAIEMDDSLEEAHDILARILYFYEWDWKGAEREFKLAIQLNPNKADVHLFYAAFLRSMNRADEAMSEAVLGLELDPLNSFTQCHYVGQLLYMQQYDDAIEKLTRILDLEPDYPFALRYLWICYYQQKIFDKAIEAAIWYFSSLEKKDYCAILEDGYKESGYAGAMHLLAQNLEDQSHSSRIPASWIARFYAHAGEKENALNWLQKAYDQCDLLMPNINSSADWEILHDEAGFKNMIQKLKLPS